MKKLFFLFLFGIFLIIVTINFIPSTPWDTSTAVWDGPGSNFSIAAQDGNTFGTFFNSTGTKMFIVGQGNGRVYQYTLSQAWNTSTAVWDGPGSNFSIVAQDTFNAIGLSFNGTGTKMFITGSTSSRVFQYTLSQAWNTSTAVWDGPGSNFSTVNQDPGPAGIFFNSTGTKMFIIGTINRRVYQYTLSQAWNTSTATWDGPTTNVSAAQDNFPYGLSFNGTGTKMFVTGGSGKIFQYTLSQAWNLSTATLDGAGSNLTVTAQDSTPTSTFINPTGAKMFITGQSHDRIYQYTLLDNPPQWSQNSTSGTTVGTSVLHSINWTDDLSLSGYIFEFDNGTGTFTNDTFVTFTGTQNWSNVSKTINTTVGSTIRWRVYVNDSSANGSANQFNSTSIFSYTTSAPGAGTSINFQTYFTFMNLTNSTYLPFIGGQTGNNAVPFVTVSVGDNDSINESFSKRLTDVYFNSTGIIIQRVQSGNNTFPTNMTIRVNVVEFNSASVRVQNGTFNISGANSSALITIPTAVDTSAAAMVFYYNSTDASSNYNSNSIMGNITNSTTINFSTGAAGTLGVKAGHWYVFESLNGGFSVQKAYLALGDTITSGTTIINSVQMNKTFLIGSFTATEPANDARDGGFSLNLSNSTAIFGSRQAAGATIGALNSTVFVITFTGNEFVQRDFFAYSAGVTDLTDIITSVNTSLTMAWNPLLTGRMGDGSGGGFKYPQFQYLNISNSTAVTGHRDDNTISVARGSWEVIQWVAGPVDNPPKWSQNSTMGGVAWDTSTAIWDGPGSNFSVAAQNANPRGIFFNSTGNKMYITGVNRVYQYTLSQLWNTSTAVWGGPGSNFSVAAQDANPRGIFINSTGTKMWIVGLSSDIVYQYTLPEPWDTSTAVWDGPSSNLSVAGQDAGPYGIFFNSTGTKMYISGQDNSIVYQYTLSQAWNTSTAVWDGPGSNFSVGGQDTSPAGIFFNSTGTKMYISGQDNSRVYQYTLSQAWNTSTATYDGASSGLIVSAQDTLQQGIFINSTGTKMFMAGDGNSRVYQYTISESNTNAGKFIKHGVNWTDDTSLSGYIFEFDNGTGTFTNDSFVTFTGTQNWSNVSKTINTTVGSTIRWRVYSNDSLNQFNSTNIFSYTTTPFGSNSKIFIFGANNYIKFAGNSVIKLFR